MDRCSFPSPRPNHIHLSVERPQPLGIEWSEVPAILECERLKAATLQPVNHAIDRKAAVLAQARGIFEDDDVGANERPAGAVDHGRLVALDVDLEQQDAAITEVQILERAVEVAHRDEL